MREHRRNAYTPPMVTVINCACRSAAKGGRKGARSRRVLEAQSKESAFAVERDLPGQREPAPVVLSERKTSERVATHFTGRPSFCARAITATCLRRRSSCGCRASAHQLGDDADLFPSAKPVADERNPRMLFIPWLGE